MHRERWNEGRENARGFIPSALVPQTVSRFDPIAQARIVSSIGHVLIRTLAHTGLYSSVSHGLTSLRGHGLLLLAVGGPTTDQRRRPLPLEAEAAVSPSGDRLNRDRLGTPFSPAIATSSAASPTKTATGPSSDTSLGATRAPTIAASTMAVSVRPREKART